VRPGRFARRALLRAGLAGVIASLVSPNRRVAALAGAAGGAAIEMPPLAAPLAVAALARASRADGRSIAAGLAVAAATTRVWPTAPRTVAELRRHGTKRRVEPNPAGEGVAVVVNPTAGSADDELGPMLRERLAAADVVIAAEDDDVGELAERAAEKATRAFGAAGGDGTLSAAAALAHDRDLVLLALPAGTLNHFARDLGLLAVDDALDALEAGEVVEVDVAEVADRTFLNTCSFGAYTDLVEAREALEDRIGKWPAVAIALVRVLRGAEPIELVVDGRPRRLWLGFIGNGAYRPPGFAPTWREVLDSGQLDIRLVDAARPFARVRLVVSVLTGRLARSTVYEQRLARSIELRSEDDPHLTLALDGEVCEVDPSVLVRKREGPLAVFAPHR
jgi:undecaprenyl-diphosphatase